MLQCSRSISKINLQLPVAFVDYTGKRREASWRRIAQIDTFTRGRPRYLRKPLIKGSKDRRSAH